MWGTFGEYIGAAAARPVTGRGPVVKVSADEAYVGGPPGFALAADEADYRAAKRLSRPARLVARESRRLWGRSLAQERDRIVAEQAEVDAAPARLQALRGHVTRGLVAQLGAEIERQAALREGER